MPKVQIVQVKWRGFPFTLLHRL